MAVSSQILAIPFQHKRTQIPFKPPQHIANEPIDFSGTWAGLCDNEEAKFQIIQNEKHISITFIYSDSESVTETFALNKLTTTTDASPSETKSTIRIGRIMGNYLMLNEQGTDYTESSAASHTFDVSLTKNGDVLTAFDPNDYSVCEFHKTNETNSLHSLSKK